MRRFKPYSVDAPPRRTLRERLVIWWAEEQHGPWLVFWLAVILVIGLLMWANPVRAETWVSPSCKLTWNAPTTGGEVQGYKVYLDPVGGDPVPQDVGNITEVRCTDLGVTAGRYRAWVTAYNPAGESGASNVVPFAVHDSAPGSPTGVAVSEIEFAAQASGCQFAPGTDIRVVCP